MVLVYHNITPPEYFVGVHEQLVQAVLPRPPRADRLHRPLRSGARRFRVQPAGARGARLRPHRRAAGRAGLHPSRRAARPRAGRRVRRRVDQHPVCRPGDPEQEVRGRHPLVPRLPHAPQSARRGCSWSGRTAASTRYLAMLHALVARLGTPDVHFLGQVSNEELTAPLRRRRPVPVRERARRLLRADRRGVLQAGAGAGLRRHRGAGDHGRRRRALRHEGSRRGRRADGRRRSTTPRSSDAIVASQDAALDRLRAKDFDGTLLALRRPGAGAARAAGASGRVGFLGAVRPVRTARGAAPVPPGALSRRCRRSRCRPDPATHRPMIVNQWVPAAHRGRRHRRQRAPRARHAPRGRPRVGDLRADDRRRPARRRAGRSPDAGARDGHVTIFHFALPSPMTEAFATLPGARVLQYHNVTPAAFFAPVRRAAVPARGARARGAAVAGRPRRSGARRLRVQPAGARGARLHARPGSCRLRSTPSG